MKIIALHPDKRYEIIDTTGQLLKKMHELVGGYVELVLPKKKIAGSHQAYVNEEAVLKQLPSNYYGAYILEKLGYDMTTFFMCTPQGVLVLVGLRDEDDASLSKTTIDKVKELHDNMDKESPEPQRDSSPVRDR
jgi:hypothetical protein